MSTRIKVAGLIVLSLVQLGAASWSIIRYERILASGTPYRIRTEPRSILPIRSAAAT